VSVQITHVPHIYVPSTFAPLSKEIGWTLCKIILFTDCLSFSTSFLSDRPVPNPSNRATRHLGPKGAVRLERFVRVIRCKRA
jgi:hypothetical protein